jgi:hypothetical protein
VDQSYGSHLPFHGVVPAEIEAVLARFATSPSVAAYTLHIWLPANPIPFGSNSLLRAAALLSPTKLALIHQGYHLQQNLVDMCGGDRKIERGSNSGLQD